MYLHRFQGYGVVRKLDPEEIVGQKYKMWLQAHKEEAKRLEPVLYLLTTYFLENEQTRPMFWYFVAQST